MTNETQQQANQQSQTSSKIKFILPIVLIVFVYIVNYLIVIATTIDLPDIPNITYKNPIDQTNQFWYSVISGKRSKELGYQGVARKAFFNQDYHKANFYFKFANHLEPVDDVYYSISREMERNLNPASKNVKSGLKRKPITDFWFYEFNTKLSKVPDDLIASVYNMAEANYKLDNSLQNSKNDCNYKAALCYKFCGKYKDSQAKYEKYFNQYLVDTFLSRDTDTLKAALNILEIDYSADNINSLISKAFEDSNENMQKNVEEIIKTNNINQEIKNKYGQNAYKVVTDDIDSHKLGMMLPMLQEVSDIYNKNRDSDKNDEYYRINTEYIEELQKKLEAVEFSLSQKYKTNSHDEIKKHCIEYFSELADLGISQKEYEPAYDYLTTILEGKSKDPRPLMCLQNLSKKTPHIGGSILFGHFEQDGQIDNGPEPIEWIIANTTGERTYLLSKYILDFSEFDKDENNLSWHYCSLKEWLNGYFLENAFNLQERKKLLPNNYYSPKTKKKAANEDKSLVILPSEDDIEIINKYYDFQTFATPFAQAKKLRLQKENNIETSEEIRPVYQLGEYWLNPLPSQDKSNDYNKIFKTKRIPAINKSGLFMSSPCNTIKGIRPVIMIKLKVEDEESESFDMNDLKELSDSIRAIRSLKAMKTSLSTNTNNHRNAEFFKFCNKLYAR